MISTRLSEADARKFFRDATHGVRPPQLMVYGFHESPVAGEPNAIGMTIDRGGAMFGAQIAMTTERDPSDPNRTLVSMWTSIKKGLIFTRGSWALGLFFKHVARKISEADPSATVDYT